MAADKYHVEVKGTVRYHYRIVAANGQVVVTSQVYYSKSNAIRAARKVGKEFGYSVVVRGK